MSQSPDPTRDELFAEPLTQPELFTFGESVAGVFPDMINRSVPGYATVVAMTGVLAAQHARPDSTIYDRRIPRYRSVNHVGKDACDRLTKGEQFRLR